MSRIRLVLVIAAFCVTANAQIATKVYQSESRGLAKVIPNMQQGDLVLITPNTGETALEIYKYSTFATDSADNNRVLETTAGAGKLVRLSSTIESGVASTATNAAVTIDSTGWTNTFGKNAVVYVTGTNTTYTVFNTEGTSVYTNLTTTGVLDTSVILQPSGKVIISGTAVFGRATPF